jgi:YHS domain-containing protein
LDGEYHCSTCRPSQGLVARHDWAIVKTNHLQGILTVDETQKVIDPICGMTVEPNFSAGILDYEGQTYYFCTNALRLNKLKLQAELLWSAILRYAR